MSRERSNGYAAGRESTEWKDRKIRELEREIEALRQKLKRMDETVQKCQPRG